MCWNSKAGPRSCQKSTTLFSDSVTTGWTVLNVYVYDVMDMLTYGYEVFVIKFKVQNL